MKMFSLCWIALVCLIVTSCKEDEETKKKIADLETTIASLESDKISLQADNITLKANQGGLNEAAAKALTDRKDQLEKEVQRLLPLETQIADLNKQIEELKTKLAAATMTPTGGTNNAAGGNAGAEISKAVESSFVSIEGDMNRGGGFLAVDGEKCISIPQRVCCPEIKNSPFAPRVDRLSPNLAHWNSAMVWTSRVCRCWTKFPIRWNWWLPVRKFRHRFLRWHWVWRKAARW